LARLEEMIYIHTMEIWSPRQKGFFCLLTVIISILALISCKSTPVQPETPLEIAALEVSDPIPRTRNFGIPDEIRYNTERATPSSLITALEIIRSQGIESTEFGRTMVNVNVNLLRILYPAVQTELLILDPPINHVYSRILREAEKGVYTSPGRNSNDYLEHVLPFLSLYSSEVTFPPESYLSALSDLERAGKLNDESVLAAYFTGIAYERLERFQDASDQFAKVWKDFPECYIAV